MLPVKQISTLHERLTTCEVVLAYVNFHNPPNITKFWLKEKLHTEDTVGE